MNQCAHMCAAVTLLVLMAGGCASKPEQNAQRMADLHAAQSRRDAEPNNEDAWIWVGRREAYLGNYDEAIATYTEALEIFPESPRLLRHRGHRQITIRRNDLAIEDLQQAWEGAQDLPDEIEPDGMPNAAGIPRSTLHTNILYHLALALYLEGRYEEAEVAWSACLECSPNDDMRVASAWWLLLMRTRLGDTDGQAEVFAMVTPQMDIIENHVYHQLLLEAKRGSLGDSTVPEDHLDPGVSSATLDAGRALWLISRGETEDGLERCQALIESNGATAAFGCIACEAELARIDRTQE